MDKGTGFLASITFLALLGCYEADNSISKPGMNVSPQIAPVINEDMDAESDEHTRTLTREGVARDMIGILPALLNELDEGEIIPECEAGDYQPIPVAENPGIPSDVRTWIDEEFVAVFLHNLGCYHLAAPATNSPIDSYVSISLDGVYTLVTDALRQRFGVDRITGEIRERGRAYLKNPRNLRRLYNAFRPQIVELLRASRKNLAIKRRLETLIPYFDRPISNEVILLSRRESEADKRCFDAIMANDDALLRWYREDSVVNALELAAADEAVVSVCNEEEAAYEELSHMEQNPSMVQWVLRRRDEGGQPLVRAWGEILRDLHRSI